MHSGSCSQMTPSRNCTFVIRFQECSWARQDVRYSDTSPCSVQTCFSSSDRGWLTCLIFHELLRPTFWWQTGDDTSCTYTRLMNMNFSRKKSILIGCLQFYNRLVSQSCAVGEQFWRVTGQSYLVYKWLAATKASTVWVFLLTQLHCGQWSSVLFWNASPCEN